MGTMKMNNEYIKTYSNVLSDEKCQELIDVFNEEERYHQSFDINGMTFTQLNIGTEQVGRRLKETNNFLSTLFAEYTKRYVEDCGIEAQQFPKSYLLEPIRIKRYLPNDKDQFAPHVDVNNKQNCGRFLSFFIYLTDNDEGSTKFLGKNDLTSSCERGKMLMFPPLWPWLHCGEKPVDKPKYIVQSYLHYPEMFS